MTIESASAGKDAARDELVWSIVYRKCKHPQVLLFDAGRLDSDEAPTGPPAKVPILWLESTLSKGEPKMASTSSASPDLTPNNDFVETANAPTNGDQVGVLDVPVAGGGRQGSSVAIADGHLDNGKPLTAELNGHATIAQGDADLFSAELELQSLRNRAVRNSARSSGIWHGIGGALVGGGVGSITGLSVTYGAGVAFVVAGSAAVGATVFTCGLAAGCLIVGGIVGYLYGKWRGKKNAVNQYGVAPKMQTSGPQQVCVETCTSYAVNQNVSSPSTPTRSEKVAENDIGEPKNVNPPVATRVKQAIINRLPKSRHSKLSKEDQQAVENAHQETLTYAEIHNVSLDVGRAEEIQNRMEALMLDRRAMFGNEYTPKEVKDDLKSFGLSVVDDLAHLDEIKRYHENKKRDSKPPGYLTDEFTDDAVTAVNESFDAIVGRDRNREGGDEKCESALADAQSEWEAACGKWLSLKPEVDRTADEVENFRWAAIEEVCSDDLASPNDSTPSVTKLEKDFSSDRNHPLRRLYARMDHIAKVAKEKHATSVAEACRRQCVNCEKTAQGIWELDKNTSSDYPTLTQEKTAEVELDDRDRQLIRNTTRISAYIAAIAVSDA